MAKYTIVTQLFDSIATWEETAKNKADAEKIFQEMVSSGLHRMNTKSAVVSICDSKGKRIKRQGISR